MALPQDRADRQSSALQQLRGREGEVPELVLVDRGDQRVLDGREGGLFLREIGVEVVHILRGFLKQRIGLVECSVYGQM